MAASNQGFDMRRRTVVLCLVLVAFASSVAAIHIHPQSDSDGPNSNHCLICAAAHTPTVLTAVAVSIPANFQHQGIVRLPEADHQSRLVSPELFIRPPPTA